MFAAGKKRRILKTSESVGHYDPHNEALLEAYISDNVEAALRKLRSELKKHGTDFTADDFFKGNRNAANIISHPHVVGAIFGLLHEIGIANRIELLTKSRLDLPETYRNKSCVLDEIAGRSELDEMMASPYWDQHPDDQQAIFAWAAKNKHKIFGIKGDDDHLSYKMWDLLRTRQKSGFSLFNEYVSTVGLELTRDDLFGSPGKDRTPQIVAMRPGGGSISSHIAAALDYVRSRGERVSVEEFTQPYNKNGDSILKKIVQHACVTELLKAPYWEDHPEDFAAIKQSVATIGREFRKRVFSQQTLNAIVDHKFQTTFANARQQLKNVGSDFEKADFWENEAFGPGLFGNYERALMIRDVMDLMHEQGETIPLAWFSRPVESMVGGSLTLIQAIRRQNKFGEMAASPYWNEHPSDLVQLWGNPKHATPDDPVAVRYANRSTLAALRKPEGMLSRLTYDDAKPEHVEKVVLYELVKAGHADYVLARLRENGEYLSMDDYMLGTNAGIPTVLDMMVEQGKLARIMDPEQWKLEEESIGRLKIGLSVPSEVLKEQTGLDRAALLAEVRAHKHGKRLESQLAALMEKASYTRGEPEEVGDAGGEAAEPQEQSLLSSIPTTPTVETAGINVDIFENWTNTRAEFPREIVLSAELEMVLQAREQIAERDAEIAELKAKLEQKPTTVTVVRQPTPSERLRDIDTIMNGSVPAERQ